MEHAEENYSEDENGSEEIYSEKEDILEMNCSKRMQMLNSIVIYSCLVTVSSN